MASPDLKSPPAEKSAAERSADWSLPLSILGTLAGAALGVLAFWGLYVSGFYAIMLPGLFAGLGGGFPLKRRVIGIGVFAAVVSLVTMLLTEWWFRPFVKDESLLFFLTHLNHLKTLALLMMALGVVIACWFGSGRDARV